VNIAWLIDNTGISGANRVVLALADAMIARGHGCSIVTIDAPLTWRRSGAEWIFVDAWKDFRAAEHDFVIATSPSTLEATKRAKRFAYYSFDGQIPDGVSRVLTPDIATIVDDDVFQQNAPREHQPARVLLSGPSHEERRGIDDGYRAVAHARWFHQQVELVRVSPFVPSREEPLDAVQEFHVGLSAAEMTRLMHSCDVVLAPDHRDSIFSLVPREALAAGVPAVMTSIPQFLSFDAKQDYALFARDDDAVEFGEKLIEMLEDEEVRQRVRRRGREVAGQWRAGVVAGRLEEFLKTE
jgi:glycosyltransferase involved in cell wall biosynthesis